MLFKDASEDFIDSLEDRNYSSNTCIKYESTLKQFEEFMVAKHNTLIFLEDIKREDIKDYISHLSNRGLAPSSINMTIYTLKSFYSYLADEKIVDIKATDNIKLLKERKKERDYLSKEEVEELAKEVGHPVISTAVLFGFYTGLRPGEMMNLNLSDVDLDNNTVWVKQGKGNSDRKIPISSKLRDIIIDYLNNKRPDTNTNNFFATKSSGQLSHQYYNKRIKIAVNRLGWTKEITAHSIRHSCASFLVKKDINIYKIMKILGHNKITTTMQYAHTNMDDLADALEVI